MYRKMQLENIKKIRSELNIGLTEAKKLSDEFNTIEDAIEYWKEKERKAKIMEENKKYGNLMDWWTFGTEYCKPIDPGHLYLLKPLTPSYCAKLWYKYVSKTHRHLMLVGSDRKIYDEKKINYNWEDGWERDDYSFMTKNIAPLLDWKEEDQIFFFWGRYTGLETTWKLFCEYWIPFMYDDEKNIIINPSSESVLILAVHGCLEIGKRRK